MQKNNPKKKVVSGQTQQRPGLEYKMSPPPVFFASYITGQFIHVNGGEIING
jgi:hypothetical protein